MSATTRWVEYEISATGSPGVGGTEGLGTRAYVPADGASDTDAFNIGTGNNRLHFTMDGVAGTPYVELASGTALDPRFVARDITEKIHNLGVGGGSEYAQCMWENGKLVLYSGSIGSGSNVTVTSGINTAHLELGWGTSTPVGGGETNNTYNNGGVTISGTYNGFFDETYRIVVNLENPIQDPEKGGSNSYTGTITTGGAFNYTSNALEYTLNIDITKGTTMGGGTGNVPKLSWTTSPADDDCVDPVELLYADYWYQLGTKGAMVKFTDAVFNSCPPGTPAWTIDCNKVQWVQGMNPTGPAGTAMYYYSSNRGDDAATSITCQYDSLTQLGTRGLYMKFVGLPADNFAAGDEFYVVCRPPQPKSYNLTNVDYGNVTVSTESAVKAVMFEIVSGAVEISTVKFGLQSHGTFEHHNKNTSDTYFRFGTVGPGQTAGTLAGNKLEWRANVLASDIASDTPPAYLCATKENLAVVADADDSETIGSSGYMGMTSDPIFMNIRLGASEVGANSLINYRVYFDYS